MSGPMQEYPSLNQSVSQDSDGIQQKDIDIEREVRIKSAIYIFGILGFLFVCIAVSLGFMFDYASKFYNQMKSGQDQLCNFYTCSNSSECGKFPKIIFPDGTEKCLTD